MYCQLNRIVSIEFIVAVIGPSKKKNRQGKVIHRDTAFGIFKLRGPLMGVKSLGNHLNLPFHREHSKVLYNKSKQNA
jgi:hypothetical protein